MSLVGKKVWVLINPQEDLPQYITTAIYGGRMLAGHTKCWVTVEREGSKVKFYIDDMWIGETEEELIARFIHGAISNLVL